MVLPLKTVCSAASAKDISLLPLERPIPSFLRPWALTIKQCACLTHSQHSHLRLLSSQRLRLRSTQALDIISSAHATLSRLTDHGRSTGRTIGKAEGVEACHITVFSGRDRVVSRKTTQCLELHTQNLHKLKRDWGRGSQSLIRLSEESALFGDQSLRVWRVLTTPAW